MNRSKLTFYLLGKKYGFDLKKELEFVNKSQYWSKQQIDDYQNHHLRKIITHAYENVPFYRKQFDSLGLKPEDIKSKKDLYKLPVINKDIVQQNYNDFLSKDYNRRKPSKKHTGGTTGVAFEYYLDFQFRALNWALKISAFNWGGYIPGKDRLGVLAGGSLMPQDGMGFRSRLWRFSQNVYSMPITRMDNERLGKYVRNIRKQKIKFLRGYPTAIATMAKYLIEKKEVLPLSSVFTTAEVLYDEQRELIRKAFGCEVFDQYGCGDGGGTAYECEEHNGLHFRIETSIVELLHNNEEVDEGFTGEVVLTNLYSYSMPLIRYAPGDMAVKGSESCSCGRTLPKLKKIIGRSSDIITFSNGVTLNGLSIPFEAWTNKIKKFQIIQKKKDVLDVLFIPLPSFSERDKQLAQKIMEYHCGDGVEIKIKLVDEIPLPKSGKFRYVISEI